MNSIKSAAASATLREPPGWRYIVTDKGPIDHHAPGTDVTKRYSKDVLARLVEEGYVVDADVEQETPKEGKKWPRSKARSRNSS